ncbi:HD domain-containing protein [Streptomyces sp. JV178]|uniref:HD domain-containing protein n=1 Tax=Streptomyces sp. JV178 TaxID=858632 RepID=UPI00211EDAE0|nr:HD domain-containing protein [Streptomyces sp. JV178]
MRMHHPDADTSLIRRAHHEAAIRHAGQTRRSGDPFLTHCIAVAAIVADIGMPPPVICAALLHDIDDSPCPPGRVTERFGKEIAELNLGRPHRQTQRHSTQRTPLPHSKAADAPADA